MKSCIATIYAVAILAGLIVPAATRHFISNPSAAPAIGALTMAQ